MALIEPLQLTRQGRFPANSIEFTAVDFETTGLTPGRVLEVGAVRVRADGTVLGELSTMVNPGPGVDPGPTHVHHITRAELDAAPRLADVLAQLIELCQGSVLVAHNLPFEARFLAAELDRVDVRLPVLPGICLQTVTRQLLRLPNYRLATIAGALGMGDFPAHLALADARVSAQVVSSLVTTHGLAFTERPRLPDLPRLSGRGRLLPRAEPAHAASGGGLLATLVDRLPEQSPTSTGGGYRELLVGALADHHLSGAEAEALARVATDSGMSSADVRRVHLEFVTALRWVAEGDGVVSPEEERDLRAVASALDVTGALADLRVGPAAERPVRVLVLGESAAAHEMRAEVLHAGIQLARKLTASVTHLVLDQDVPSAEPRITRAAELGAVVVGLADARAALGLVTAPIPAQTAVLPVPSNPPRHSAPPAGPPPAFPAPPARPVPSRPSRKAEPDGTRLLGTVAGWSFVVVGLLIMFVTVLVAFGGAGVAPSLVFAVLGVGSVVGGWWLTERYRAPVAHPG